MASAGAGVTVAVVGAGGRGTSNSRRIRRAGGKIVAVAEPVSSRRKRLANEHGVDDAHCFVSWEDLASRPRCADAVLVTTQDRDHVGPCEHLAELGYHILCEKPVAPTEADAQRIEDAVLRAGVHFALFHSLRYTRYTTRLIELLRKGAIGDVMSVQHLEPVGWWHFAHSYVRGPWSNEATSSSLLLAKSCHDLDWLGHVVGARPVQVSSFGHLSHFRPEHRPPGASSRCIDCAVEPECPYSAPRLYRSCLGDPAREHWPLGAVVDTPTVQAVEEALADGPYGRCVYDGHNDVVDHQVVSLDFENGVTATHTVTAFTPLGDRRTRVFGTHGSIEGDGDRLTVHDFRHVPEGAVETIDLGTRHEAVSAHDEGDQEVVRAFLTAVASNDPGGIVSGATESVDSHRVVWAAEEARRTSRVVPIPPRVRRP